VRPGGDRPPRAGGRLGRAGRPAGRAGGAPAVWTSPGTGRAAGFGRSREDGWLGPAWTDIPTSSPRWSRWAGGSRGRSGPLLEDVFLPGSCAEPEPVDDAGSSSSSRPTLTPGRPSPDPVGARRGRQRALGWGSGGWCRSPARRVAK
jgi:hypothetical protein